MLTAIDKLTVKIYCCPTFAPQMSAGNLTHVEPLPLELSQVVGREPQLAQLVALTATTARLERRKRAVVCCLVGAISFERAGLECSNRSKELVPLTVSLELESGPCRGARGYVGVRP